MPLWISLYKLDIHGPLLSLVPPIRFFLPINMIWEIYFLYIFIQTNVWTFKSDIGSKTFTGLLVKNLVSSKATAQLQLLSNKQASNYSNIVL